MFGVLSKMFHLAGNELANPTVISRDMAPEQKQAPERRWAPLWVKGPAAAVGSAAFRVCSSSRQTATLVLNVCCTMGRPSSSSPSISAVAVATKERQS